MNLSKASTQYKFERKMHIGIIHLILVLITILYIIPPIMTILYSFKDRGDMLTTNPLELPSKLFFGNYIEAFEKLNFIQSFFNSFIITVFTVVISLLLASMAAYGIARGKSKRFTVLYLGFVFGLLIPYQAVFVPIYLMGSSLNLINTFFGIILFYIAGQLPFAVFMMTGFMKTVPENLEQAAQIDGCGKIRIFFQIVFPLLKPSLLTLAVLRALIIWNDYLLPKMFLQKRELQTLIVRIAGLFGQYRYDLNVAFAAMILASLPILIFFLYNQSQLEKGIALGAIKG